LFACEWVDAYYLGLKFVVVLCCCRIFFRAHCR